MDHSTTAVISHTGKVGATERSGFLKYQLRGKLGLFSVDRYSNSTFTTCRASAKSLTTTLICSSLLPSSGQGNPVANTWTWIALMVGALGLSAAAWLARSKGTNQEEEDERGKATKKKDKKQGREEEEGDALFKEDIRYQREADESIEADQRAGSCCVSLRQLLFSTGYNVNLTDRLYVLLVL